MSGSVSVADDAQGKYWVRALFCAVIAAFALSVVIMASPLGPMMGWRMFTRDPTAALSFGSIAFLFAAGFAIGAARKARYIGRLAAGEDVIARWHMTADEWRRYRLLEHVMQIGDDIIDRARGMPPPEGVDIIAGGKGILTGRDFHALRNPQDVAWVSFTDPQCIQFCWHGDESKLAAWSVPVSPDAVAEARRVFDHWDAIVRDRRAAFRRKTGYNPDNTTIHRG